MSLRMEDYGHSNRIGLMVHLEGNIGADYFTAQNVGFGISYVLPIVLALVKAEKGRINHSGESGSAFTSKRTEKNGRTDRQSSTGRCAGYCRNA